VDAMGGSVSSFLFVGCNDNEVVGTLLFVVGSTVVLVVGDGGVGTVIAGGELLGAVVVVGDGSSAVVVGIMMTMGALVGAISVLLGAAEVVVDGSITSSAVVVGIPITMGALVGAMSVLLGAVVVVVDGSITSSAVIVGIPTTMGALVGATSVFGMVGVASTGMVVVGSPPAARISMADKVGWVSRERRSRSSFPSAEDTAVVSTLSVRGAVPSPTSSNWSHTKSPCTRTSTCLVPLPPKNHSHTETEGSAK